MKFICKTKEKIKQGKATLGGWCLTFSPVSAEIMSQAGFDWICVDAEHSPINMESIYHIFMAIEKHGADPFVRISLVDEVECKKVLDSGAKGVIVPMITSAEDVEKAVYYTKFSPIGNRSFSLARCTGYGSKSQDYFKQANDNLFLGIMIEHINALKDLDKIFLNKNIDAVLVGPYDLSGSMGIPGQFDNPDFLKALNEISDKAKQYNINMGIHEVHPTLQKIKKLINDGYKFIGCGIDTLFIAESASYLLKPFLKKSK